MSKNWTSKLTSNKRADCIQLIHLSVKDICRVYACSLVYFKMCDYDLFWKKLKQNQTILPAEYCSLLRKINQITPYKNIRELLRETSGNPEQDSWCTDVKHTRPSGKTNDAKAQWRVLKWTIVIEICWQAFNVQLNTVPCSFCLLQGNNNRFPWQKVTLKW